MIGRLATTIGLGALAVVATAGHVQAQQRGEECRVEEMDPRRGPAQQTFCRGPDGQWRPRPDLDAATASGRPTASRPAAGVPAASVLPEDWRGTITYSGMHQGYVQQAGPGMRDLSVGSVVGAVAGGQRQRYAGRYDLVLTIDGASVTGQASGTGGLEPATFSGIRTGALCRMFLEGAEIEATCTSDQFVGTSRSPQGASPSFLMNIDLRATRVVDAAEEERQRAEAAERARAERAEAEAAERARIAAMPAATAAQAQMVERAVRQDSGAWLVNRYDVGSVTNVRVADRDGGITTFRAEYTYNGGAPGWVLARVSGGAVECLGYWDMGGCGTVRAAVPARTEAAAQSAQPSPLRAPTEREIRLAPSIAPITAAPSSAAYASQVADVYLEIASNVGYREDAYLYGGMARDWYRETIRRSEREGWSELKEFAELQLADIERVWSQVAYMPSRSDPPPRRQIDIQDRVACAELLMTGCGPIN